MGRWVECARVRKRKEEKRVVRTKHRTANKKEEEEERGNLDAWSRPAMPSAVQRGRHRPCIQPAGVSAGDVTAEKRVSTQDDVILLHSPSFFLTYCQIHFLCASARYTHGRLGYVPADETVSEDR